MKFPRMFRISQRLEGPRLANVAKTVHDEIRSLMLGDRVKAGQTIAITAGSRGIANIANMTRALVDECKSLRLIPFIVPSMGSHGEAIAERQKQILAHYGITEQVMACPIKSNMTVVQIGEEKGIPIFCDRNAWEADHIAVVARIKAHTDFNNEIESGLFKMMAMGLGKQHGAKLYHRAAHHHSYAEVIPAIGKAVLKTGRILFGLAIVENGYQETANVRALLPHDFYETESTLLRDAKLWAARLPFDILDLLILDEMGKNISGAGMDPDVIGRVCVQKLPDKPRIRRIYVRDLTPDSGGNATGIGMADITSERLVDKINHAAMKMNTITSGATELARVPMAFSSDREAIKAALGMIGLIPPENARVVRIRNTLLLTEMDVSECLLDEVLSNDRLSQITKPATMVFDEDGNLPPFRCVHVHTM